MASLTKRGCKPKDMPKNQYVSNPFGMMAAEIVVGAVSDWRSLIRQKAWLDDKPSRYCNVEELRIFFNSEWCEFLMQDFSMKPHELLQLLEKELQEARRKGGTK